MGRSNNLVEKSGTVISDACGQRRCKIAGLVVDTDIDIGSSRVSGASNA